MSLDAFPGNMQSAAQWAGQTYDAQVFTVTASGFIEVVTASARYVRAGQLVVVRIPGLSGTSNATSFAISGIPTAIQVPAGGTSIHFCMGMDNGVDIFGVVQLVSGSIWNVYRGPGFSTLWTSSGIKAVSPLTVAYLL